MSVFDGIHSERHLSLKHWRYRLLHWTFNEKAKTPEESSLPKFLYTHYCPLFHLTNFIALFSWAILIVKVMIVILSAIGEAISKVNWSFLKPKSRESKPKKFEFNENQLKEQLWRRLINIIVSDERWENFDLLWSMYGPEFIRLDKEEVRDRHKKIVDKVRASRERKKARQEKIRTTVLFWINFSQIFVKWALLVFYIALAVVAAYLAYLALWPVIGFFKWLFSFEISSIIPIIIFGSKVLFFTFVGIASIMLFRRFRVIQTCIELIWEGLVRISPPFKMVGQMIFAPFKWFGKGCMCVSEFIKVFYEENCPPITIVSEEDESIEMAIEEIS